MLHRPQLLIADVELARTVLINEFELFMNRTQFSSRDQCPGEAVGMSRDDEWRQLRSKLTPAFTSKNLKQMMPLIDTSVDQLISAIKKNLHEPIDMLKYFIANSVDIIAKTSFSTNVSDIDRFRVF